MGQGGERPIGAAAYGGNGLKGRAAVSGERPIGAASCRQQHNEVSCQPLPPLPPLPRPRTGPSRSHWARRAGAESQVRGSGRTPTPSRRPNRHRWGTACLLRGGWGSITGADPGQDPTPKPPPPPSTDPKMVVQNNGFCGRWRRRRFCFRHTAGGSFFVRPHVSVLKIFRILWRIQKWLKSTKKDFDPDPASGSDLG